MNLQRGKKEGLVSAPLVCAGTKEDLARLGVTLREGMEVLLYEPDPTPDGGPGFLEVLATIRYDADLQCFVGDFAWDDLRHRPEGETRRK